MIKSESHGSSLIEKEKNPEDYRWFSFSNIERGKFVCIDCFSRFDTKFLLNLHRITQCAMLPYKCEVCNLRFSMKSRLLYHQRIHGIMKLPKKEEPDSSPTSKPKLNILKDMEAISDSDIYPCSKCNLTFNGKRKLERHERIHSDKKYYQCDRCHLGFFWKSNFNRHRKNSCGKKEYSCKKCSRTFSKRLHLIRHQNSHVKAHKYLEEEIGDIDFEQEAVPSTSGLGNSAGNESFPDTGRKTIGKVVPPLHLSPSNAKPKRLQDILKSPVKDEPVVVNDNKWSKDDSRDKDYDPKEKKKVEHRYRCKTCGTGFKWKCDLARHWRTHGSIKPFLCDKCELGFNWKSNLVRHQKRIHMGAEDFVCDRCGRGFIKQNHLVRHQKNFCRKTFDDDSPDGTLKVQSNDIDYKTVIDKYEESKPVVVQVYPDEDGNSSKKGDLVHPPGSSKKEHDSKRKKNIFKINQEVNIVYLHPLRDEGQMELGNFENSINSLESEPVTYTVASNGNNLVTVNHNSCSQNKKGNSKNSLKSESVTSKVESKGINLFAVNQKSCSQSKKGNSMSSLKSVHITSKAITDGNNLVAVHQKSCSKSKRENSNSLKSESVTNKAASNGICNQSKKEAKKDVATKITQDVAAKMTLSLSTNDDECVSTNSESPAEKNTKKEPKEFACSVCDREFTRKSSFMQHERSHYKQLLQCEWCHRNFERNSVLVKHQRIHTGEKPYQCEGCLSYFRQKSQLVQHRKIHTGVKLHECEVCKRRFGRKSLLVRHRRIHTGEKPFECEVCHICFNQKSILVQHQRVHSGLKPYKCKKCNFSFTQKWNYQRHRERVHVSGKQFSIKCDSCDCSFPRKKILIQHQAIHQRKVVLRICDSGRSKKPGKNRPNSDERSERGEKTDSVINSKHSFQSQNSDHVKTENFEKISTINQEIDERKEVSTCEDKSDPMKIYINRDLRSSKTEDIQDPYDCPKKIQINLDHGCIKETENDKYSELFNENNHINLDIQSHKGYWGVQKEIHPKVPQLCTEIQLFDANNELKVKSEADVNITSFSEDIITGDFRSSVDVPAETNKNNEDSKIPRIPEKVKSNQLTEKEPFEQDKSIPENVLTTEKNNAFQKILINESGDFVESIPETKECTKVIEENTEIYKESHSDIKEEIHPYNINNIQHDKIEGSKRNLVENEKRYFFENSRLGENSNSAEKNPLENKNLLTETDFSEKTGNNIAGIEPLKDMNILNLEKISYEIQKSEKIETDEKHKCSNTNFGWPPAYDAENMHVSFPHNSVDNKPFLGTQFTVFSSCKLPEFTNEFQRKFTNDKSTQRFEEHNHIGENIRPKTECIETLIQIENSDQFGIPNKLENPSKQVLGTKLHDIKRTGINSDNLTENLFDQDVKNKWIVANEHNFIGEVSFIPESKTGVLSKTDDNAQNREVKRSIKKIRRGKGDFQLNDNYEIRKGAARTKTTTYGGESQRKKSRKLKRLKSTSNYKKSKTSKKTGPRDDLLAPEENDENENFFLGLKESVITALTSLKIHDDCDEDVNKGTDKVAENHSRIANNGRENILIKSETGSADNITAFGKQSITDDDSFQVPVEKIPISCDINRALINEIIQNEQVSSHLYKKSNEDYLKFEYDVNRNSFEGHVSNSNVTTGVKEEILPQIDKCYVAVDEFQMNQMSIQGDCEEIMKNNYLYREDNASQMDQARSEDHQKENDFRGNVPNDRNSIQSDSQSRNDEFSFKSNYQTNPIGDDAKEEMNTYQVHNQENFPGVDHKFSDDVRVHQNSIQENREDNAEFLLEEINPQKRACHEESVDIKLIENSNKKANCDQDFPKCEEFTTDNRRNAFGESAYQNVYDCVNTDQVTFQEVSRIDPNLNQENAENQVSSSGLSPDLDQNMIQNEALAQSYGSNGNHTAVAGNSSNSNDPLHYEENICSFPIQNNEFYNGSNASHQTNDANKNAALYTATQDQQIFFPERIQNDQNFIGYEKLQPYQGYNFSENIPSQVRHTIPKEMFISDSYKQTPQALPSYQETFSKRNFIPNDITQMSGLFYPGYGSSNQNSIPYPENPSTSDIYNVENCIPFKGASSKNFPQSDTTHVYQNTNWDKEVHSSPRPKETMTKFDEMHPNLEHARYVEDHSNSVHVPYNPPVQESFPHMYGNQVPDYYDNNYQYPTYDEDSYNYSLRQEKVRRYSVHHEEIHTVQDLIRFEKTYAYPTPPKVLPSETVTQPHRREYGYGSPVRYNDELLQKQRETNVQSVQSSSRLQTQPLQFPPKMSNLPPQNASKLNLLPSTITKDIAEKNALTPQGLSRLPNQGSSLSNLQIPQNPPGLNMLSSHEPNLLIKPAPQYPANLQFFRQTHSPVPQLRFPSSANQSHQRNVSAFNQSISLKCLQDQDWCKRIIFNNDQSKRIRTGSGNASQVYVSDLRHSNEIVPEARYVCDKCDQNFNSKEVLIRHRFTAHEKIRTARFCNVRNR
ncbi:zinc finger protein 91 [Nephila pilipes]|uniref:Zinc finger protein 91 n=1 Tax=Nephila pilipes TaxID=299642 RepID=A0A8X6T9F2_NEPPI|nr:zinc finger protein 91 [Nephila pilipes]